MILEKERELVVKYGKKFKEDRLTTGTSGNISIYNKELSLIAISPSGIDYDKTEKEDVTVIDLDGNIVDGKRYPSSEIALHLAFYKEKEDARAVVHCHSVYCVTLSTLNMPIKAYHYVIGDANTNEIPCVPYVTFGTKELANETIKYCKESNAAILKNHGQITCAKNIESAYSLAINVEYLAEIQYRALTIGNPKPLSDEQMKEVLEKFKTYGQSNK